jgi:hypothetical protein
MASFLGPNSANDSKLRVEVLTETALEMLADAAWYNHQQQAACFEDASALSRKLRSLKPAGGPSI